MKNETTGRTDMTIVFPEYRHWYEREVDVVPPVVWAQATDFVELLNRVKRLEEIVEKLTGDA